MLPFSRDYVADPFEVFDEEKTNARLEIEQELKSDEKEKVKKAAPVPFELYAVSGSYFPKKNIDTKFEIDQLKDAILRKLPDLQQSVAAVAFDGWTRGILDAKFRYVQGLTALLVLTSASLSGGSSLIPLVNIPAAIGSGAADIGMIVQFNKKIARIYNFTQDGKLVDPSDVDEQTLRYVDLVISTRITTAIAATMTRITTTIAASTVAEAAFGIIPFVGAAVSAAISGTVMSVSCHKINKIYYEAALEVIKSMNNNSEGKKDGPSAPTPQ